MNCDFVCQGVCSAARVLLEQGETLHMTPGDMIAMDSSLEISSSFSKGGLGGALTRALSGEKINMQVISAPNGSGEIMIAPSLPGEITLKNLAEGEALVLNHGAYMASESTVKMSVTTQKNAVNALFSGSGLFLQRVEGPGLLLFSSQGSVVHKLLRKGEEYIVDNGNLLAWSETVDITMKAATKGLFGSMTSEGLVCSLTGRGDVYIQTRSIPVMPAR